MKKIVCIAFLFVTYSLCCSTIVVLRGASSAGKSSIIRELTQKDNTWHAVLEDEVYEAIHLEAIAERFPHEYTVISQAIAENNRFHAIKRNHVKFIASADQKSRENALSCLKFIHENLIHERAAAFNDYVISKFKNALKQNIQNGLREHKNVILESWSPFGDMVHEFFPHSKVIKTLAIASLSACHNRFKMRNEIATTSDNIFEKRFYRNFLNGYTRWYRLTNTPLNSKAVIFCTRRDIEMAFNEIYKQLPKEKLPFYGFLDSALSCSELDEMRSKFMSTANLERPLFIEAAHAYDLIINTDDALPEESACVIREFIKSKELNEQRLN